MKSKRKQSATRVKPTSADRRAENPRALHAGEIAPEDYAIRSEVAENLRAFEAGEITKTEYDRRVEVTRRKGLDYMFGKESAAPIGWWYLSFASEQDFLGACWVKASGILTAAKAARTAGCDPGGSVMARPVTFTCDPPVGTAYVLHRDRDEIRRLYELEQHAAGK